MANWKSNAGRFTPKLADSQKLRRPNISGLALVPLSPSPDPISLAFDAAMVALSLVMQHSGSEEANDLVQRYQNPLQTALGTISNHFVAQQNTASPEQLYQWAMQVKTLGDRFLAVTLNYPNKGAGARATILGVKLPDGSWQQQPPNAPGYLTGLLANIVNHARSAEMRQGSIGFDWDRLFDFGQDIINRIPVGGGIFPEYPTDPADYYPMPYPQTSAELIPGITNTQLLLGGVLLLFVAPKLMKALK